MTTRRTFLKTTALGLAAAAMPAMPAMAAETKRKPNVIYILVDDLGYGDLGCYGQKKIKTPQIDALAKAGLKFTDHYSGSALCAPSRCILMTGMHAGHAQIRNNKPLKFEGNFPLTKGTETVATLAKRAGYATGAMGKWGLGYPASTGDPNNQGFDHFFGYNCLRQAHSYYPTHLWRNQKKVMLKGDGSKKLRTDNPGGKYGEYSHDLLTAEALGFVKKNKDKPFFLYLAYTVPHTAFQVPDLGQYKDMKGWTPSQKCQAAMISRMDADVGKLVTLLKELGLEKDTLVIFASDNGAHGGGGTLQFFNASGPLKGKKRGPNEGGIRVPMIARWPGKIKPATTTHHPSAFYDVLATVGEVIGETPKSDHDGISFLPTLLGKDSQKIHEYLYWELGRWQVVRLGNYKAICVGGAEKIKVYDLANDLGETQDIASSKPALVQQFKVIFKDAHTLNKNYLLGGVDIPQKQKVKSSTEFKEARKARNAKKSKKTKGTTK